MVTIRCTQKLLRRMRATDVAAPSTTLLGDWCANILFSRPEQLVLCVSERTLLPVVVPARPAAELGLRLAAGLGRVLAALDVPDPRIAIELREMSAVAFARTQKRSVLGSLNDLMFQLTLYLHDRPEFSLFQASLKLGRTPLSAIGQDCPDRLTKSLFAAAPELV